MRKRYRVALGKVPKIVWIVTCMALVPVAAAVFVLNNQPYAVLATGLTTEEVTSITSWLEGQGVRNYRLEGSQILVPEGQESNLKARMIMEGYPKSGCLYDTSFDSAGSLSTEPERKRAFLLALQERLSTVVSSLEGVESACVSIAREEPDLSDEASATVSLTMEPGRTLSREQAGVIWDMVSGSVRGVNTVSITVDTAV